MRIILWEDPVRICNEFDREVVWDIVNFFNGWQTIIHQLTYQPHYIQTKHLIMNGKYSKRIIPTTSKCVPNECFANFAKLHCILYSTGQVWPKSVSNKLINRPVGWFFVFLEVSMMKMLFLSSWVFRWMLDGRNFYQNCKIFHQNAILCTSLQRY